MQEPYHLIPAKEGVTLRSLRTEEPRTQDLYPDLPIHPILHRCHDHDCPQREACARYIHRETGNHLTEHYHSLSQIHQGVCENHLKL